MIWDRRNQSKAWRVRRGFAALLLCGAAAIGLTQPAAAAEADFVASLRQAYAESAERLHNSPFHRPLYLESTESAGSFEGTIHAVVERPFADLQRALSEPARWCELLILLPNIADCHLAGSADQPRLALGLVRKVDAPRDSAMAIDFAFERQQMPEGLQVQLEAARGPLGTRNYRIVLEAVPLESGRSFLHLRYAYRYGLSARLAAQLYLSTSGSAKRGFSAAGREADGSPRYIGGLRGAVERNAMRCYLAIDAYLGAFEAPAPGRFEATLQRWVGSIGQYRQLQEEDVSAYVAAKRRAHLQQRAQS